MIKSYRLRYDYSTINRTKLKRIYYMNSQGYQIVKESLSKHVTYVVLHDVDTKEFLSNPKNIIETIRNVDKVNVNSIVSITRHESLDHDDGLGYKIVSELSSLGKIGLGAAIGVGATLKIKSSMAKRKRDNDHKKMLASMTPQQYNDYFENLKHTRMEDL